MKTTAAYTTYTAWDLALDDDFIRWVKTPDAADNSFWEKFLADYPHKAAAVQEARALLLHYTFAPAPVDAVVVENIWQQLQLTRQNIRPRSTLVRRLGRQWRYAAAILLLITAGIFTYRHFRAVNTVVITGAGEMRRITFADGSQVVLNQQSRLRYNNRHPYTVQLEGEAYFTIQKSAHAPAFTVQCSRGNIQVLGTAFNVNTQQQLLKVVLEQGAVQVVPANPKLPAKKMQPGEMVTMDAQGLHTKRVHAAWHTAWRNNQLLFSDAPLADIFTYLTDVYGWQFVIQDPLTLANKRFNGTAPANTPGQLLEKISTIYQLKMERRADTVFISKGSKH